VIYPLDKKLVRNGLDTGGILNAKFMGGGGRGMLVKSRPTHLGVVVIYFQGYSI
jgi:hypothetical protein